MSKINPLKQFFHESSSCLYRLMRIKQINLKKLQMENAIMLHNLSPKDLEELIRKVVSEQLEEFRKNLSTENPDKLLTREEACLLLKISLTSLWYWTKKGKLIAYGIGNRVYYKRTELMESLIRIN